MEWKTMKAMLEEMAAEICRDYCKYPNEIESQEELDKICEKCPFEKIV